MSATALKFVGPLTALVAAVGRIAVGDRVDTALVKLQTQADFALTPTTMQRDLIVPDSTQKLFRRPIKVGAGQRIVIGADAVLVNV